MHVCGHVDNSSYRNHRFAGLVVKASVSSAADPGFDSRFLRGFFFPGWSHTSHNSDLKMGIPVANVIGSVPVSVYRVRVRQQV